MKSLLALIIMLIVVGNVSAETVFTYEKAGDRVKIISTETTINTTEQELSIEDLEIKKASLEVSKINTLTYYNENIARLNAEIVVIEEQITEAGKLGIIKKEIIVKK